MSNNLLPARAAVVAARAAIAERQVACDKQQAVVDAQKAILDGLAAQRAQAHVALLTAQGQLEQAEEAAIKQLAVETANEIIKRHSADPLGNSAWVIEWVVKLRAMVRSGFDTPNNERYQPHPLITQALALLPPVDDMDRPVYELGGGLDGAAWPRRRHKILATAYPETGATT